MEKTIIGIVGPIGAGKDTAAKFIGELISEPTYQVSFSTILREKVLEPKGLPPTRENLQHEGQVIDRERFRGIVAEALAARPERIIILTGARKASDIDLIRSFPRNFLIAVDADLTTCFERVRQRNEKPGEGRDCLGRIPGQAKRSRRA